MTEKHGFKGYWRHPQSKKFTHYGELSFNPTKGATLEVLGSIGNQDERTGEEIHDLLHGFTTDGKRITLINCEGYGSSSLPGISITRFNVDIVLVGDEYLNSIDELQFDTTNFHLRNFDEWVAIHGFDKSVPKNEELVIRYNQPEPIEVFGSDTEKIYIWFSYKGPSFGYFIKENSIVQKALFEIEFSFPTTLRHIVDKIIKLRNFVSFGLSKTTQVTSIKCFKRVSKKRTACFEVLTLVNLPYEAKYHQINPSIMLFSFSDIKDYCKTIFHSWFDLYDKLNPVFELYFQSLYNRYLGDINYFLNLAFALETYHRRTETRTEFTDDEYAKLSTVLMNAIKNERDPRIAKWLNGKLLYGNEISFRTRLKSILNGISVIASNMIIDIGQFVNKVVDTRNYFVHFDESLKGKVISQSEFFQYNIRLKLLLQVCLLKELKFNDQSIKKFVERTPTFWNVDKGL